MQDLLTTTNIEALIGQDYLLASSRNGWIRDFWLSRALLSVVGNLAASARLKRRQRRQLRLMGSMNGQGRRTSRQTSSPSTGPQSGTLGSTRRWSRRSGPGGLLPQRTYSPAPTQEVFLVCTQPEVARGCRTLATFPANTSHPKGVGEDQGFRNHHDLCGTHTVPAALD